MNTAVILAGGVGARVGAGYPKQFIEVLGKPIIAYTLEVYQRDSMIDNIMLVCVATHMELMRKICEDYGITKVKWMVPGGDTFVASCICGMKGLEGHCSDDDIVVVTSGDRPFTSEEEIDDSIRMTESHGCGVAGRTCPLCLFEVGEDRSHSNAYKRDNLILTATPWTFRYRPLMTALEKYARGEFPGCEAYPIAIFAADGHEIWFSRANPRNIKITEKTDVALMEQMLREEKPREKHYLVGYTQGTYDMFHIGHLNVINQAKKYCDYLIVGVNSDRLVESYKNKTPVISEEERQRIVSSVKAVGKCVIVDTLDKLELLKQFRFDAVFIGDDWKGTPRWEKTQADLAERGVDVVFLHHTEGVSSSLLRGEISHRVEE